MAIRKEVELKKENGTFLVLVGVVIQIVMLDLCNQVHVLVECL